MAWATGSGDNRARRVRLMQGLEILLTAFGLSCIQKKDEKFSVSKWKFLIPCIIIVLLFYIVIYMALNGNYQHGNIGGMIVSGYLDLTGCIVVALAITSAVLNTKRYARMKQGFLRFDSSITFNIDVIARNSGKYFILYLTLYAVSFIADFILYRYYDESPIPGVKLFSTYVYQLYNIAGIFHFSFCLFWLRKSFAFINADVLFQSTLLQKKKPFEFLSRNVVNPSSTEVFFVFNEAAANGADKSKSKQTFEKVRFLRCLYHELYQLSREVDEAFSTRNVLTVGHNFVLGTIFIYGGISELVKYTANQNNTVPLIEIFVNFKWSFISFLSIFGLIWPSTSTCAEAAETRILIQELLTKTLNQELREELQSFALQFNHEVVHFTPHGFFYLNNNLLMSIIGAVVSYLVVLIQFRITMA